MHQLQTTCFTKNDYEWCITCDDVSANVGHDIKPPCTLYEKKNQIDGSNGSCSDLPSAISWSNLTRSHKALVACRCQDYSHSLISTTKSTRDCSPFRSFNATLNAIIYKIASHCHDIECMHQFHKNAESAFHCFTVYGDTVDSGYQVHVLINCAKNALNK